MNGKKVVSLTRPLATEIVEKLGYTLVDIEYGKKSTGMVLELFIDSPKGITLDDCERVSRAMDNPLDELNPTSDEPYSLNVSSLGLDRPLTTEYQFNKYKGADVEVKFYKPLKPFNKKQIVGKLNSWDLGSITFAIGTEGTLVNISRDDIAQIVPVIDF